MQSEKLRRARAFEQKNLPAAEAAQPRYHATGGVGWINDPNGFSVYRGEYHLFFQYYPYENRWGPMHWGHVKSKDFLRWERLPAAMAPDEAYDRDGCFSGSAMELDDGRHLLMYTGVRKDTQKDGTERERQTQCLAIGDGADYEKYAGNPVIGEAELPPDASRRDFRDPKIWREGDRFYAVAGNRCPDGSGAILRFESGDARHWRYAGVVAASRGRYGRMWECPDLFSLDGARVLLVSAHEMTAEGLEFLDGNGTICFLGEQSAESAGLDPAHVQAIDYGLDFYAPQTLCTPDGRRVMIAWMQYWGSVDQAPKELPFFGQMTVPRELRAAAGRLIQNPVRELERYRGERVFYEGLRLAGQTELPGVRGRCLDMTVTVRPDGDGRYRLFRLEAARGQGHFTAIEYDPSENTLRVDRSHSGVSDRIVNERRFAVRDRSGGIKLRVLLDRYSLELFVNDGEQAASFTLYTPQEADGVSFAAEGSAVIDVEKYSLEFCI